MEKKILATAIAAVIPVTSAAAISSSIPLNSYVASRVQNKMSPSDLLDMSLIQSHQNSELNTLSTNISSDEVVIKQGSKIKQLVIIDTSVTNIHAFTQNLSPNVEVAFIDAAKDGKTQLENILTQYHNLDAIHLVSHAEAGRLKLGNNFLASDGLDTKLYSVINQAVKKGGDILLFGCDLGATKEGEAFINLIKDNTHVDIAASTDKTGNIEQGGDWDLELVKGNIDIERPFNDLALKDFTELLGSYSPRNFCNDANGGRYRSNISTITSQDTKFTITTGNNNFYCGYSGQVGYANPMPSTHTINITANNSATEEFTAISIGGGSCSGNKAYGYLSNSLVASSTSNSPVGFTTPINMSNFSGKQVDKVVLKLSSCAGLSGITSFSVADVPTYDSDGNLTSGTGVSEPVNLNASADTVGEAVDLFDFKLVDGGASDGLALEVSQIAVNVSGTSTDAQRSAVTWRLNGPDVSNLAGTYNGSNDRITFSGLSVSVADGASETYTINAYYNDNSSLIHNNTYTLSVDGDTDLTVSSSGTQMGSTSAVNNGIGAKIIDDIAPSVVSITTPIEGDGIINAIEDNDVLILGTGAEASATINVAVVDAFNNGPITQQVTADGSGNWTLASNELDVSSLNNGELTISVTQTDAAGNISLATTQSVTLDNQAPSAVSISTPIEVDNIVNASEDDSVLVVGSGAEPNGTVSVNIGGVQVQVTADSNGDWTLAGNELDISALNNGSLTVSVSQTDAAGNTSTSLTKLLTLDNVIPSTLTLTTLIEGDGKINASEDNHVLVQGSGAEAGATVSVAITDNAASYTKQVTADSSGNWTLLGDEIDVSALNNGSLTISAVQFDTAGNASVAATQTVTLDNQIPTAVTITMPIEGDGKINASEDADVLIEGSGAEAGAIVDVTIVDAFNNGYLTQQVTADSSGNWTLAGNEFDVSTFNNGDLTITVTQTDAAGNISTVATQTVTLDNEAPTAVTITTPIESDGKINTTEDADVLIEGSGAEAGAIVDVTIVDAFNNGYLTQQVTADSSGNWTIAGNEFDVSNFNNGDLTVTVTQTDAAGNTSITATQPVTLDNQVPSTVNISTPISVDNIINASDDESVLVSGSGAEPNATITVEIGGVQIQVTADNNGNWTLLNNELDISALNNGSLTLSVIQTDAAGNTSTSLTQSLTLDNVVPESLTITTPIEGDGIINGSEDNHVLVQGSGAEANASITVDIGGVQSQVTADANGDWTLLNNELDISALNNGELTVSAVQTDTAGNTSVAAIQTVTLDNQIPTAVTITAPIEGDGKINASEDADVLIEGSGAEAGAIVDVTIVDAFNNGYLTKQVTADSSGNWTIAGNEFDVSTFNNGDLTITVTQTDAAGNISTVATQTVTLDNEVPTAVTITTPIEGDGKINASEDADVLIEGSGAEAGAIVDVTIVDAFNNGYLTKQVTADSSGNWTLAGNEFDVSTFNNGDLIITVSQTDAAGNTSNLTEQVVVLDTEIPNDFIVDLNQGVIDINNEKALSFALAGAELNSTYSYIITDINEQTISGTGTVTSLDQLIEGIDVTSLAEGNLTLSVTLTDSASNQTIAFTDTVEKLYQKPPVISLGDSIAITMSEDSSPQAFVLSLDATDVNQDSLTWSILSPATNGQASVGESGEQVVVNYTPDSNYYGVDSFTVEVNDGKDTDSILVNVTIDSVNDQPMPQGDSYEFAKTSNNIYSLNVLSNDSDIDGDELIIEGVNASIGAVVVENGVLIYTAPDNYIGGVTLNYSVRDGNSGRAKATAQLTITGILEGQLPVVTQPSNVSVNATGLFTKIDLGVATAVDALGNPLPVSLVDGITLFKPGNNTAYWRAIDNIGNETTAEQKVVVQPLVSMSKNQVVPEGTEVRIKVLLNGTAPTYPIDIPFSLSGTAIEGIDFTLEQETVVITEGTQAELVFTVLNDDEIESDETLIVSLSNNLNLGAKNSTTIRISEANIAPSINLAVKQSDQNRLTVSKDSGIVKIEAIVIDPNPNDVITNIWSADQALINTSSNELIFEFDPSELASGVYKATLTSTDNGLLSDSQTVYIELVESLTALTSLDTDGDLIPDDEEGYADSDGDGIPDYLDSINECNVVPEQISEQNGFLVEGDPGVCLRKGVLSAVSQSGGLLLDDEQIENDLPNDEDADIQGGVFDFTVYGLPEKGQNYQLVIPQITPIPQGAIYRKFSQTNGWFTFVEDSENQLFSTRGEMGYCPPPGDNSWEPGLTAGDWCVQLQIQDGGPNDNDGQANGSIDDPGGIAVASQGNEAPVANDDTAELSWNMSITIDVLTNDTDADNDTLTVTSASASFGQVIINTDNTVTYTPNADYAGNDTIDYGISDGQGGSDAAQVMVTVRPNREPVAQADDVTIDGSTATVINVLSNDSDIDGDSLTIESASAQSGEVIISDNSLIYTAGNFIGEDTITYSINDGQGGRASSTLTITVTGPKTIKVDNKSSGGTNSVWGLLGLLTMALFRRKQTKNNKGVK